MALYGYKESPRLWADFRDNEVAAMKIPLDGGWLTLEHMVTEPNLWRILQNKPGLFGDSQAEELVGLLLVYVDDLLTLGSDSILNTVIEAIRKKWEISTPEAVDSSTGVVDDPGQLHPGLADAKSGWES